MGEIELYFEVAPYSFRIRKQDGIIVESTLRRIRVRRATEFKRVGREDVLRFFVDLPHGPGEVERDERGRWLLEGQEVELLDTRDFYPTR